MSCPMSSLSVMRKCVLCNVLLTTSKKYYCIDRESGRRTLARQNLKSKIADFLEADVMSIGFKHGLAYTGHLYVCESCIIVIEGWARARDRRNDWLAKYGPGNSSYATTNMSNSKGHSCKVNSHEINKSCIPASVTRRICVMCNELLTTKKKYYCIDRESRHRSVARRNLESKIANFLEVDIVTIGFQHGFACGTGHLYICESCVVIIEAWERATKRAKLVRYGPGNTSETTSMSSLRSAKTPGR